MGAVLAAVQTLKTAFSELWDISSSLNETLKRASESASLPSATSTDPYWLQNPPYPELVNIQSPVLPNLVDVAIIGSGIAAAAIARSYLRTRRDDDEASGKVAVFEAREICSGATARNGGHLKPVPHESFSQFKNYMSAERAAELTRFQMRHIDCLINICESEGIDMAEARYVETSDFFLSDGSFKEATESIKEVNKWLPEIDITVRDASETKAVCCPLLMSF